MAEQIKTHWKKLTNPNYIGAHNLMQGDKPIEIVVTIKSVAIEKVKDQNGKDGECMVAQLVNSKPMIINKTNAKVIEKMYATPYIEDWKGKSITLYVAKVRVGGETVDAIRVRPTVPKGAKEAALPDLNPQHEKWNGAVTAITNGGTTLDKILKAYNVSDENKSLLFAPLQAELIALIHSKGEDVPEAFVSNARIAISEKNYTDYFALLTQLKEA